MMTPGDLADFGFPNGETYANVSKKNRLMFRVHRYLPDTRGLVGDLFGPSSPVVVAPDTPCDVNHQYTPEDNLHQLLKISRYRFDISPYVSTSFNVVYAIQETIYRYRRWSYTSPFISIIDSRHSSLQGRSQLGVERLATEFAPPLSPNEDDLIAAKNYANAYQEALVAGYIPNEAIISTVPWTSVQPFIQTMIPPNLHGKEGSHFQTYTRDLRNSWRAGDFCMTVENAVNQAVLWTAAGLQNTWSLDDLERNTVDLALCIYRWARPRDASPEEEREIRTSAINHGAYLTCRTLIELRQSVSTLRTAPRESNDVIMRLLQSIEQQVEQARLSINHDVNGLTNRFNGLATQ